MPKENNFEVNDDMGDDAMAMLKNATATYIAEWLKTYAEPQPSPQQQQYKDPLTELAKVLQGGSLGSSNNFWNK